MIIQWFGDYSSALIVFQRTVSGTKWWSNNNEDDDVVDNYHSGEINDDDIKVNHKIDDDDKDKEARTTVDALTNGVYSYCAPLNM